MTLTALIIIGLFILSFGFKIIFPRLCSICFAVAGSWMIGFVLGFDSIVLALLMGGSAVGFMYYLFSVLPERFAVFKLPFLLSLFSVIFSVLKQTFEFDLLLILLLVWVLFGLLFISKVSLAGWFKKVVECCKNW